MAFLFIVEGARQNEQIDIDKPELTIGRAPDNDVVFDDPSLSGRHCLVLRRSNRYTIRDLGSTNGTVVNDFNIRETRLKPGDIITIGNEVMKFDGDDVEVDELSPDTAPDAARPATVRTTAAGAPPAFGARKQTRKAWTAVMIIVIAMAVAAATWFIARLFFT